MGKDSQTNKKEDINKKVNGASNNNEAEKTKTEKKQSVRKDGGSSKH